MTKYDYNKVEKKWQEKWLKEGIYTPDVNSANNPFYNLWMYPYPSAEGLHAGHAFSSTGSDVFGRFMRMHGKDVFQPIGYDSFGMHAENYALKTGEHPSVMLKRTTKHYEDQLKMLGHGYDWSRTVTASDVDYYRWTQWIFTELFKAGLAYQKEAPVNFCPSCKTVIADEQVIDGKCERCKTLVEKKNLKQWFFRITDYADRLLEGHKKIKWSEIVVTAQKNWIDRSEGAELFLKLKSSVDRIKVFTTRPDTIFGATFLVLSPESPWVEKVITDKERAKVLEYIKKYQSSKNNNKKHRISKEKTGVFTGEYVINPATGKEIPIYISDYVLAGYGSGAIMGVPAHDQRDYDFAKKFSLSIVPVIEGGNINKEAYEGSGKMINSKAWNNLNYPKDYHSMLLDVEKSGWGHVATNYHLRDWLISRQRYWGPPIPLIYCPRCANEGTGYLSDTKKLLHKNQHDWSWQGWYPENNLPVTLPDVKKYKPEGTGRGPLADHPEFYETICPSCGDPAKRETDVSDTFLDSSWYFLRYPSVGANLSKDVAFVPEITKKWLPVDLYFGGSEHSVLHLMYARFMSMVLFDLGYLDFDEPFPKFFAHGLMIKDGAKMSKSRGNVVNPDKYIEKFGADAFRLYVMFMGPMDGYPDFRDTGIEGMSRFVGRLYRIFEKNEVSLGKDEENELSIKLYQTIKKVSEDIQEFKYNTAISAIMIFVNYLEEKGITKEVKKILCKLVAPFAPHLAEEVWVEYLGEPFSVHKSDWPKYEPNLVKGGDVKVIIQVNGKLRGQITLDINKAKNKEEVENLTKKDPSIAKWLDGKDIVKVIFIPERLINFVTS